MAPRFGTSPRVRIAAGHPIDPCLDNSADVGRRNRRWWCRSEAGEQGVPVVGGRFGVEGLAIEVPGEGGLFRVGTVGATDGKRARQPALTLNVSRL